GHGDLDAQLVLFELQVRLDPVEVLPATPPEPVELARVGHPVVTTVTEARLQLLEEPQPGAPTGPGGDGDVLVRARGVVKHLEVRGELPEGAALRHGLRRSGGGGEGGEVAAPDHLVPDLHHRAVVALE